MSTNQQNIVSHFLEAARQFCEALAAVPENKPGAPMAYDRRLFGEYLWSLQANLALLDGNMTSAKNLFQRCLAASPDNTEYRAKLAIANARTAVSK